MVAAWRMASIEKIIDAIVDDAEADFECDHYPDDELTESEYEIKIGEALSELDEVREDTWRYHLDNHPGPIAYCEHTYCNEDTRASLVASILRGE